MWSTAFTVLGTLGGVILGGSLQHWAERRTRAERHRKEVAQSVGLLLRAILAVREAFWWRVARARQGEAPTREEEAAAYRLHSAMTTARDDLALLVDHPSLVAAAEDAAWQATLLTRIDLGPVTDERFASEIERALSTGRDKTRDAHTRLRRTGTAYAHNRTR
ncbi:hypothetical protein ACIPEL_15295 [Streptomyces griseoviridis]